MNAHKAVNDRRRPYILEAAPDIAGTQKGAPGRLEALGPYDAIGKANNAYAVGRAWVLPAGYNRPAVGVVFEATRFAAEGVARCGYNVYRIRESRYIAHRPGRLQ
jgi:hypothetical protein